VLAGDEDGDGDDGKAGIAIDLLLSELAGDGTLELVFGVETGSGAGGRAGRESAERVAGATEIDAGTAVTGGDELEGDAGRFAKGGFVERDHRQPSERLEGYGFHYWGRYRIRRRCERQKNGGRKILRQENGRQENK